MTVLAVVVGLKSATAAPSGDVQAFELRPVPVADPPLKYQLQFPPQDRRPGNAAIFYMRAALLLSEARENSIGRAFEALDGAPAAFDASAAPEVRDTDSLVDLMDVASHRRDSEWDPGLTDRGMLALLPELNKLRTLSNLLSVRARHQLHQGNIDAALVTIRLGLDEGRSVGQSPVLISGLVGVRMVNNTCRELVLLMNGADAPNLYWSLAALPRPLIDVRKCAEGERWSFPALTSLMEKAKSGELTTEQWRELMTGVARAIQEGNAGTGIKPKAGIDEALQAGGSAAALLPLARQRYAQAHQVPEGEVAEIDAYKIVAAFYFDEYQRGMDERFKALELPFPEMVPRLKELDASLKQMSINTPGNPFAAVIPAMARAAETFVRADRHLCALTAVEAIRSYAGANEGQLPKRLEDLNDTPAPLNPRTGKPFEYTVTGDSATLADPQPAPFPLKYTIRIRK